MADLSIDDIKAHADATRQHSYQMMIFNMDMAKDGVTVDAFGKVVNNATSQPGKIQAVQ